jgi:hypothetical protein
MPHVSDSAILAALHAHKGDHRAVADALGVPIRRVARVDTGGSSAHDPREQPPLRRVSNLHPDEAKLDSPYGPYWRQFGLAAVQVVRPKRTARMVPDDRESWDFDTLVDVSATALSRAQRDEGRGAA